jgi:hypothetical protein
MSPPRVLFGVREHYRVESFHTEPLKIRHPLRSTISRTSIDQDVLPAQYPACRTTQTNLHYDA